MASALFFLLPVMSHPEQNPCITKQLDQKPLVKQQGSVAPYLLLRWEMEGKRVSGWEGRRIGGRGGRTARTGVWLTDQHKHFSCRKGSLMLKWLGFYVPLCVIIFIRSALMKTGKIKWTTFLLRVVSSLTAFCLFLHLFQCPIIRCIKGYLIWITSVC